MVHKPPIATVSSFLSLGMIQLLLSNRSNQEDVSNKKLYVDVGGDGVDRVLGHQLHTDRSGHVIHDVRAGHHVRQQQGIGDGAVLPWAEVERVERPNPNVLRVVAPSLSTESDEGGWMRALARRLGRAPAGARDVGAFAVGGPGG